ncbi:MAG TPA: hypothetical protein VGG71_15225 [Chitinophagaceae bacterium]|jgi:hypothetical protein
MNTADTLANFIFKKNSLDDCSLEELQAIDKEYPYFKPVQFLLTEKLKTIDEDLYNHQLQKLSLHFHNPLWLDFLLNGYKTGKEELKEERKNIVAESPLHEEKQNIAETFIQSSHEIVEPAKEEINEPPNEEVSETLSQNENVNQGESNVENSGQAANQEVSEGTGEIGESKISISLPDLNQAPSEQELSFQPYHTVDYFASQGIKFVAEERPTDRFGQQLKSFTDWLKAMKRLPQTDITKISDAPSEQKVEQLASHSIDEGDVVTEAMAEVWEKQGNKEKAIEIYNKLSLLNPAKSAYFASLAEQLKNS